MPIYEYRCADCGALAEMLVKSTTADDEPMACPKCGSTVGMAKIFSVFATSGGKDSGENFGECYGGGGHSCGGGCGCASGLN